MSIQTVERLSYEFAPVPRVPRVSEDRQRLYRTGETENGVGSYLSASAGELFSMAEFGRDTEHSLEFAMNRALLHNELTLSEQDEHLVVHSIEIGVRFQGVRQPEIPGRGLRNSEEFGRMHHEARWLSDQCRNGGEPTKSDRITLQLIEERNNPDDDPKSMVDYGSVDATPLFVRSVADYGRVAGPEKLRQLLHHEVQHYRGETLTIGEGLLRSMTWIENKLTTSARGFVEYYRLPGQEQAIENQVWEDSLTSNIHDNDKHKDGELANVLEPIAAIEVQGMTYDALRDAAIIFGADPKLAASFGVSMEQVKDWLEMAHGLRERLFKEYWIEDEQRFAQSLDYDPDTHESRRITTPTATPFMLLNSQIFDDMADSERQKYIQPMLEQMFSGEFLTDAGLRCRAASRHELVDFTDYHGSAAVWGWFTHWVANGLRRQGLQADGSRVEDFEILADELDKRVLDSSNRSGGNHEFLLVDPETGEVYYDFMRKTKDIDPKAGRLIVATNLPEEPQAWQVFAVLDIKRLFSDAKKGLRKLTTGPSWVTDSRDKIIGQIGAFDMRRPLAPSALAIIDVEAGKQADGRYHELVGQQPLRPPTRISRVAQLMVRA